jgi:hypothetical protein
MALPPGPETGALRVAAANNLRVTLAPIWILRHHRSPVISSCLPARRGRPKARCYAGRL